MPSVMGIYAIRSQDSNRIYIGSSKNVRKRLGEHANALRRNQHVNFKLSACYKKHSILAMEICLVCQCESKDLECMETMWIKNLDCYRRGLNCTPTANGAGKITSLETRVKIGNSSRGRIPSAKTRQLISIASKNQSEESRRSAAEKKRGRKRSESAVAKTAKWHLGKKRSETTKTKMSAALSKIKESHILVIWEALRDGKTYDEIGKMVGVSKQTICNLRAGKNKHLSKFLNDAPPAIGRHSQASRLRRSMAAKGKKPSDEARLKMSLARKGKAKSVEHKKAISDALKRFHENKN